MSEVDRAFVVDTLHSGHVVLATTKRMVDQCSKDWPVVIGPEGIEALSLVHRILGGKVIHAGKARRRYKNT